MLARLAAALTERLPLNFDRLFGASYNTRSALEALLAHTPNFYVCRPGRLETNSAGNQSVKDGHKHLIWLPNEPHALGIIATMNVDMVISESMLPRDVVYEALQLPTGLADNAMTIDVARRHAQIQIALIKIGVHLGFKTWVAQNDRGIRYEGKPLVEHEGVVSRLTDLQQLSAYADAAHAARLIDCIWFKNGRLMPAVMEIEHSTGITSGLDRMRGFFDLAPALRDIRWVIVAPDEERDHVFREAQKERFRPLQAQYFSYSAVEDLFSLCQRRTIKGITEGFIDSFMEPCL